MDVSLINGGMPEDDPELVRKMSLRWLRAAGPHTDWAKAAKQCTDFLEGRQWTEEQKAAMREIKRSALTINLIAPLWRLVMGYQSSNRVEVNFMPKNDSQSSQDIGEMISAIHKAEATRMGLKYTDSEVFADGLTTGRGWWDSRLVYDENDFGEIMSVADDPFTIFVDPDCNTYDPNRSAAYITESVWTDLDSVASLYGEIAADAVENVMGSHFQSSMLSYLGEQELSPKRFFGQYEDEKDDWNDVYHMDFVDKQAKRVRLLDSQYAMTRVMPCFVDLETGDKEPIPDDWLTQGNQWKIEKSLEYAEKMNNPLQVVKRPVKRIRWTVTCADILLFDKWSPYDRYTKTPYYPYFRRGKTRGMIDDLIDPQMEKNKKRSVLVDILNRNANSGWMYEENTLDPDQEENLRRYGSAPGINVKWKRTGQAADKPERIQPGGYPQGLDRLEEKSKEDLNYISGINESALGQLDTVQSGRAIEARQRQAVLSIQMYSDNFSRSKQLQGEAFLEIFQKYYTEERVFRVIGEDSNMALYEINKKQQTGNNSFTRLNDITVGKYSVHTDEVPISATFKQGQFEETMMLLEKLGPVGMILAQSSPDLIIDQTSLPRKEDWKKALMQATSQQALMAGSGGGSAVPPASNIPQTTPEGYAS